MTVGVYPRFTAECYECGYVSAPMLDEHEARDLARAHACPAPDVEGSER